MEQPDETLTAALSGDGQQAAAQAKPTSPPVLPKRALGGTGVEVTILNLGTWMSPGGGRLLRYAWANAPEAALFNSEHLPASPFRQSLPVPRRE